MKKFLWVILFLILGLIAIAQMYLWLKANGG